MASRRSYKKLYECNIDNQVWLIRVQHEWDFDEHQSWNFTCSVQCSKIRRLNIVLVLNKWECNTLLDGIDTTEIRMLACDAKTKCCTLICCHCERTWIDHVIQFKPILIMYHVIKRWYIYVTNSVYGSSKYDCLDYHVEII